MQHTTCKQTFVTLFALITVCFIVLGFAPRTGLDSYEIYLNNQLVLKQAVNQPLSLRKLQLHTAKSTDQLRIRYRHCHGNGTGTDRTLVITDEKGNVLKKWRFSDAKGSNTFMMIPVAELLQLEKKNTLRNLSLHYKSQELPKGELLASFRIG